MHMGLGAHDKKEQKWWCVVVKLTLNTQLLSIKILTEVLNGLSIITVSPT